MEGIVTKSTGKWYIVKLEDGRLMNCRIKGKFRLGKFKLTNPIAVGDKVWVEQEKGLDTGMIAKLFPRENYVLRQSTRRKHYMHLIAANIDQAFIIVTIQDPMLKPGFIDRFLLTTESHNIPTYIIVNKADIYTDDDMAIFNGLKQLYAEIGYQTKLVSAETGTGIEDLKELLKDKTTLLSGHSGVGKSSIVNCIQDNLELDTQEISEYSGKGMHTTTFAQMHELEFGGVIIDTPGIKEMGFINMDPADVAHNFREIFEMSEHCKYGNCMHMNEPHCAVKEAVESGAISILRYQSYLSILEDVMGQNSWERLTDW
ncbi:MULTISPECIES: ribosome small subunit-dependent GTPase A [unclassified Aureispira]|uniref:ribosome small subunit-dependent GTPase A n=1 Tax=unclassified Aureispira TaxID=2649989 RepID=UPI000696CD9D|nr:MULTISPECIES: ribosome small subunit-dependent GTPase A [unclassified Aureispira]WMX16977.1 ribosome small subunit-dependent GTPase A [Aureispira sp. CCB-E]